MLWLIPASSGKSIEPQLTESSVPKSRSMALNPVKKQIVMKRVKDALDYLHQARTADSQGQHEESRECVSLAITKLAFLLDWMHAKSSDQSPN
jgi:hypothetical protein